MLSCSICSFIKVLSLFSDILYYPTSIMLIRPIDLHVYAEIYFLYMHAFIVGNKIVSFYHFFTIKYASCI